VEERSTGSEVVYYKYKNASRSWLSGQTLTEGSNAKDAAISGDYKGNIHVVWEDAGRIYHRLWNVTGEEWEQIDLVAEDGSGPTVICDRTPNTHVIWLQGSGEPGGPAYLAHRYVDAYGDWTEPAAVSPANAYSIDPTVAVDQRNGLHAIWKMRFDSAKDYDMFYAYRKAGREWGPFERILDGSGRTFGNPSAAADKDNFVHLVWEEQTDGRHQIYYRPWKGSWEEPSVLTESSGSAYNPVIATDEGYNVHVVWEDTRDQPGTPEIYYIRLWPLGIWSDAQRLTTDHAPAGESSPPRLEISSRTRDLHVVWSDAGGGVSQVLHRIWPGQRKEDVTRTASRARSEMAEVQREPFNSPEANEKNDQATAAYESGLGSLRRFDVDQAKLDFLECISLLEEGHILEDEYKERKGTTMGVTLGSAGLVVGAVVLVAWVILRQQEL
jgi:hypothetical protein